MLQLVSLHSPIRCLIAGIELEDIEAEPENKRILNDLDQVLQEDHQELNLASRYEPFLTVAHSKSVSSRSSLSANWSPTMTTSLIPCPSSLLSLMIIPIGASSGSPSSSFIVFSSMISN